MNQNVKATEPIKEDKPDEVVDPVVKAVEQATPEKASRVKHPSDGIPNNWNIVATELDEVFSFTNRTTGEVLTLSMTEFNTTILRG